MPTEDQSKREKFEKEIKEPTLNQVGIIECTLNPNRGFYVFFGSSQRALPNINAGRKLDKEVPSRGAGDKGGLIE